MRLASSVPDAPRIEGYWPDYEWLASPNQDLEVKLPPGTFFDVMHVVHLVRPTSTRRSTGLVRVHKAASMSLAFGRTCLVQMTAAVDAFVENDWVGRILSVGDEVRFQINEPCPRCVMTTLPQGDLPRTRAALRTIVQHNQGNVGVLAAVVQGGRVKRGDAISLV